MKVKNILFALLGTVSISAFATTIGQTNLGYTEVGKLEGSVPSGQDVQMKIHYKWLNDTARRGVLSYSVNDTSCTGNIDISEKPGFSNVEGDIDLTCNFPAGGKQLTTQTKLQLYQGQDQKEVAVNDGTLNVTW